MEIKTCSKVCDDCGFKNGSQKGILTAALPGYVSNHTLFPCHAKLSVVSGSVNSGIEEYMDTGEVEVCRGYVISMYKAGVFTANITWSLLYEEVLSSADKQEFDSIMPILEALDYHGRI